MSEQFLHSLIRSRLHTADFVRALRRRAAERGLSSEQMAESLVLSGDLTAFQATRLLAGNWRGLVLGSVVIQDKLGEGGMGEVFRAEHRGLRRQVVVKILPESATRSEVLLRRFHREVEAAARLIHPNIVTAYDAGHEDGLYFLVMEYVNGRDLGTVIDTHGAAPVDVAVGLLTQAAEGLKYAHQCGVIHRDVKPRNLLLDQSGVLKILDLGLALFQDPHTQQPLQELTGDRSILGTVEYMSPEQADDASDVDHRTDIYSLGCTLYRLLVGTTPYHRETPIRTLVAHRTDPIPSLRAARPDVPLALEEIFRRMLAKDPADRYPHMQALLDDLAAYVSSAEFVEGGIVWPDKSLVGFSNQDEAPATHQQVTTLISAEDLREVAAHTAAVTSEAPTHPAVGIDLGTTFSMLAYIDAMGRPHTLPNAEGDKTTPSMLLFDDGEVLVGREALRAVATELHAVAASPKREMGARRYHRPVNQREYPPEVLQAYILRKLIVDARAALGDLRQAVITVPAYFDEARRKATQDAGYIAGLEVLDIINEPTAAALAFAARDGLWTSDSSDQKVQNVMIYDLGGGTFDVTVMEIQGRNLRTLSTDGDMRLGGLDWDQRLLDWLAEQFLREHGIDPRDDPRAIGQFWRDCEEAKRTLSVRSRAQFHCQYKGKTLQTAIRREDFRALTADLLDRTAFTTRCALQASGLKWDDIDRVLLVGGATRMPQIRDMLRQLSGKDPDTSIAPDEAVAHGAAIHAQLILSQQHGRPAPFHVTNVNSHSLGVAGADPVSGQMQTAVLIPRNTPLPAAARRVFLTQKPNQRSIRVQIVEGESLLAEECAPVARCVVRQLPPDLPRHTPVVVRFEYAENGRLDVEVTLPRAGATVRHELYRDNSLSAEERQSWRGIVCRGNNQPDAAAGQSLQTDPASPSLRHGAEP